MVEDDDDDDGTCKLVLDCSPTGPALPRLTRRPGLLLLLCTNGRLVAKHRRARLYLSRNARHPPATCAFTLSYHPAYHPDHSTQSLPILSACSYRLSCTKPPARIASPTRRPPAVNSIYL